MVFLHLGSGKKVSFFTQEVRESQGIIFLEVPMNPGWPYQNMVIYISYRLFAKFRQSMAHQCSSVERE